MGHYRSEMGFENQDRKEAEEAEERWKKLRAYIRLDIERRDVSSVLADMLSDPILYKMKAR